MLEAYYVGAYWGARREELTACAQRAELFFHLLARCDASLSQWYRSGRTPQGAPSHAVSVDDQQELESLLSRGRIRTDLDEQVIESLGFTLEVWNHPPDSQTTSIRILCGGHSERVSNTCLVDLPSEGEAAERMLSPAVLAQMLEGMAEAWDPDWGVVGTNLALNILPTTSDHDADLGWMNYFARRRGTVPPLPAPVRIQPVGSLGMLVILTPERFTASNPEHIALGRRVHELLDRAGLLTGR